MDILEGIVISVATSGAVAGIISLVIRSYITTLVSHSFNKKIEEHRQSLNVVTEHAKFDLQRKLHDFTLYTAKRHEAYVELYNLLRAAADRVCNLEHQEYLNFAGYGREEFEDYLRREGMKNRRIEELSNEWQSGGIDEVNKALEEHNYVQARTDLNDAADLYRKHYLYLSPSMCDIIGNLLKSLQKLLEECAEWYSSVHSTITLSSKRQDNYTLKVAKLQEGIVEHRIKAARRDEKGTIGRVLFGRIETWFDQNRQLSNSTHFAEKACTKLSVHRKENLKHVESKPKQWAGRRSFNWTRRWNVHRAWRRPFNWARRRLIDRTWRRTFNWTWVAGSRRDQEEVFRGVQAVECRPDQPRT